jgi:hypothetical protein
VAITAHVFHAYFPNVCYENYNRKASANKNLAISMTTDELSMEA